MIYNGNPIWGVALPKNKVLTKKKIKELEQEKAKLSEELLKYCITQGAVSEKQRLYFIQCIHPINKALKETSKELKEAIRDYNLKHEKEIK